MTRKKMALIIAFNLILAVVALLWYRHTPPFSLVCQGNLTFSDLRATSSFRFEGALPCVFIPTAPGISPSMGMSSMTSISGRFPARKRSAGSKCKTRSMKSPS
jgi:hypothetical protein